MKRPTIFRTVLILGSASAAMWQAPRIIALVDQVRANGGFGGLNPAAAFAGKANPGAAAENISLDDIRSIISGASPPSGSGASDANKKPGDVIIFTPRGAKLSEQERQRLRRQAENLRPNLAPTSGPNPSGHGDGSKASLPALLRPSPPPTSPTPAQPEKPESPSKTQPPESPTQGSPQPPAQPSTSASSSDNDGGTGIEAADADTIDSTLQAAEDDGSDPLAGYGDGPPLGPVGIHEELRNLLDEITPPSQSSAARRGHRRAWRTTELPKGARPTFIIGPPLSGTARSAPALP